MIRNTGLGCFTAAAAFLKGRLQLSQKVLSVLLQQLAFIAFEMQREHHLAALPIGKNKFLSASLSFDSRIAPTDL